MSVLFFALLCIKEYFTIQFYRLFQVIYMIHCIYDGGYVDEYKPYFQKE